MFCITLLLYWVFIYLHYFVTVAIVNEKFETEFPLISNCKFLLAYNLYMCSLKSDFLYFKKEITHQ